MTPQTLTLPVASARMYSGAPPITQAWRRLLEWVTARAGVQLEVLQQADPDSFLERQRAAEAAGYPKLA